uniref:Uncharacterized protein n=1 Tax=Romanomermis culicivorax TaxID=13658 RepID=A0A915K3N6_ROMCU
MLAEQVSHEKRKIDPSDDESCYEKDGRREPTYTGTIIEESPAFPERQYNKRKLVLAIWLGNGNGTQLNRGMGHSGWLWWILVDRLRRARAKWCPVDSLI